jgi:hypothetical protein
LSEPSRHTCLMTLDESPLMPMLESLRWRQGWRAARQSTCAREASGQMVSKARVHRKAISESGDRARASRSGLALCSLGRPSTNLGGWPPLCGEWTDLYFCVARRKLKLERSRIRHCVASCVGSTRCPCRRSTVAACRPHRPTGRSRPSSREAEVTRQDRQTQPAEVSRRNRRRVHQQARRPKL